MSKPVPATLFGAAALLGAALALAVVLLALRQPWLGLRLVADDAAGVVRIAEIDRRGPAATLAPGGVLDAIEDVQGQRIALSPRDIVEEPDIARTYAEFGDFLARQGVFAGILRQGGMTLVLSDGTRAGIVPSPMRPLRSLPTVFWVQIFVGLASFLIGAWVWSLRREEDSTRLFALVGANLLIASFPAAFYSTRELAIDGGLFRLLSAINHFGTLGFGVAMIALFLVYPRRIAPAAALGLLPLVSGAWWLADTFRIGFPSPVEGSHLPAFVEMIGILAAVALQYRATHDDPRARAALTWFGLGVVMGAGAFVLTVIAPNVFGMTSLLSQGEAFLFFLLIHTGVALGVARYRLFRLDEWAFRILFYVAGAILLVGLDAILTLFVVSERVPAFGLALLIVAFAYLPLRDMLARRLAYRREISQEALFQAVVDVALTPPGADQNARWAQVLRNAFNPLHMDAGTAAAAPAIADEGLALLLPGIGDLVSLRLSCAQGGRKLFSPRDAALAAGLCAMLRHAVAARDAYEQGAAAERARISRDMHDNIGAQLLSALHSCEPERKDEMIRETLGDLRNIVNNASRSGQSLEETLADLRLETSERLSLAGLELDWKVSGSAEMPALPPHAVHAMRSILREAVSNAIRHADAKCMDVSIACRDGRLFLSIEDDGKGFGEGVPPSSGSGFANIRTRLATLAGALTIENAHPGLRLVAQFPCREES